MIGSMHDRETFNGIKRVLRRKGFTIFMDPEVRRRHPMIAKDHYVGSRPTPHGLLQFVAETYPTGCKFEFYQEIVRQNPNGGRYDFDKRRKMPFLVGKGFELAVAAIGRYLLARGFVAHPGKLDSANPDPLAYFNSHWDTDSDRRRGAHRFERDASGWPAASVLADYQRRDAGGSVLQHGCVRYFRDVRGYLARGRCYGGINGMWLVVYGPGRCDFTHLSARELATWAHVTRNGTPKRRVVRNAAARLEKLINVAAAKQDFEAAIRYRDALQRLKRARFVPSPLIPSAEAWASGHA
jgi:hypothetical protein